MSFLALFSYKRYLAAGLAFLLFSAMSAAEETAVLSGLWKNQRGSTLELKQDGNHLSGTFITAVARTEGCIGYKAPILGFANNNAMSLSFSMEGCGSPVAISLTGILMLDEKGEENIKMQALIQQRGIERYDSQTLVADYYHRVQ